MAAVRSALRRIGLVPDDTQLGCCSFHVGRLGWAATILSSAGRVTIGSKEAKETTNQLRVVGHAGPADAVLASRNRLSC